MTPFPFPCGMTDCVRVIVNSFQTCCGDDVYHTTHDGRRQPTRTSPPLMTPVAAPALVSEPDAPDRSRRPGRAWTARREDGVEGGLVRRTKWRLRRIVSFFSLARVHRKKQNSDPLIESRRVHPDVVLFAVQTCCRVRSGLGVMRGVGASGSNNMCARMDLFRCRAVDSLEIFVYCDSCS